MAEERDDIEVTEEKGGKSKLIIIIVAALVLIGGGVGAFLFLSGGDENEEKVEVKLPPIYSAIEEPFIVNFSEQSNGQVSYMKIQLKVKARSQAVIDAVTLNMPAIQHELNMLFFSQNYDELQTTEGTKKLQKEALNTINKILDEESPQDEKLEAVYFTSFIMQ
ncbi:MAG TPA: flagellar basal body protein FliL [Methylophaga aminisulfidivorans]|uniref:Flagellar protein FliL n=2 Tax=root TaxID=1 RepID=A0A7C1VWE9_9GAMM|nr:flagellar basal body protein FliL [Methylophaga aminisulfidivorans]